MYGWIWRTLPGGVTSKALGCLLLTTGVVAALLLVVFPRVEPLVPFQNVTVTTSPGPTDPPGTGPPRGGAAVPERPATPLPAAATPAAAQ